MTDYKVNFKDLKAKVGIDDVAYALGYRLDRKAGVGRYMELVLGDGKEKRDALVICHPQDKASQRFFRRDGSKGDVVTLIRENLNAFNVSGKDEWQKIAKVLSRFANMPEPEYREDREYVQSARYHATFDSSRYEVKPINPDKVPAIFQQRGFSDETVRTFAPFIRLIRDRKNENFDGYNIGFPYTNGENNQVRGYEMRGYGGYKSKAAGSDSSSSAWVADLSGGYPNVVKSVFFCESAFDAMAFYQLRMKKDSGLDYKARQELKSAVFISTGGNPSYGQIQGVVKAAPGATFHLGFDNDLAGKQFVFNFESIVQKMNPLHPESVASDMKGFIETFKEGITSTKELLDIDDDRYVELPEGLQKLYLAYDTARNEAWEYHYSPFLCKEDKQEAADRMNKAYQEFKQALFQKLHVQDGQDLNPIGIVRELPSEGYKDFNDELLEKKQYSMTDVVETAFDENGVSLTEEREEENEETKKSGLKR